MKAHAGICILLGAIIIINLVNISLAQTVPVTINTVVTGNVINEKNGSIVFVFDNSDSVQQWISWTTLPCKGPVNMYIGANFIPTPTNYTWWYGWTSYSSPGYYLNWHTGNKTLPTVWYITVVALEDPSGGKPYAAKFDFVVTNNDVSTIFPLISDSVTPTVSLINNNQEIRADLVFSSFSGNNYTLYLYNGTYSVDNTGYTYGACSIDEAFSVIDPPYTVDGDTYHVTVDNAFDLDNPPTYSFVAVAQNTAYLYKKATLVVAWSKDDPTTDSAGNFIGGMMLELLQ